jgi:predicted RNA-binding protein YlqC (UPF0109 family)
MQEMLHDIVIALLNDNVKINITKKIIENGTILLEIVVDKKNMSKIIGKKGKTANSIRNLMKAYAQVNNQKIFVQIVEPA